MSDKHRYSSYGNFLRTKFGCKVYKVSVDGGFNCPNRDGTVGTGGCTYCNNDSFRPATATRLKSVQTQAAEGIEYLKNRYGRIGISSCPFFSLNHAADHPENF